MCQFQSYPSIWCHGWSTLILLLHFLSPVLSFLRPHSRLFPSSGFSCLLICWFVMQCWVHSLQCVFASYLGCEQVNTTSLSLSPHTHTHSPPTHSLTHS